MLIGRVLALGRLRGRRVVGRSVLVRRRSGVGLVMLWRGVGLVMLSGGVGLVRLRSGVGLVMLRGGVVLVLLRDRMMPRRRVLLPMLVLRVLVLRVLVPRVLVLRVLVPRVLVPRTPELLACSVVVVPVLRMQGDVQARPDLHAEQPHQRRDHGEGRSA